MINEIIERVAENWVSLTLFPAAVFLIFTLHEAGHYVAARLCGVRVLSFTIGLGPCVRKWTDRHGTLWAVHLMPLCGMLQLAGEDQRAEAAMTPDMFCAQPVWQRALIVAAGPLVNIILALVFIVGFYAAVGIPAARPAIPGVEVGSPADMAGLQPGDMVTHVDGVAITRYAQLRKRINDNDGKPMTLGVQRGEENLKVTVVPVEMEYVTPRGFKRHHRRIGGLSPEKPIQISGVYAVDGVDTKGLPDKARAELRRHADRLIDVALYSTDGSTRIYRTSPNGAFLRDHPDTVYFGTWPAGFYERPGLWAAVRAGWDDTARLVMGTVNIAAQMFPVDAARFSPEMRPSREDGALAHDIFMLVYISALWSVFTACFNLLPIPRLDGGALVMLGAEAALGRDKAMAAAPYIMRGAILLCFMVMAFLNAGDFMTYMNIK